MASSGLSDRFDGRDGRDRGANVPAGLIEDLPRLCWRDSMV